MSRRRRRARARAPSARKLRRLRPVPAGTRHPRLDRRQAAARPAAARRRSCERESRRSRCSRSCGLQLRGDGDQLAERVLRPAPVGCRSSSRRLASASRASRTASSAVGSARRAAAFPRSRARRASELRAASAGCAAVPGSSAYGWSTYCAMHQRAAEGARCRASACRPSRRRSAGRRAAGPACCVEPRPRGRVDRRGRPRGAARRVDDRRLGHPRPFVERRMPEDRLDDRPQRVAAAGVEPLERCLRRGFGRRRHEVAPELVRRRTRDGARCVRQSRQESRQAKRAARGRRSSSSPPSWCSRS